MKTLFLLPAMALALAAPAFAGDAAKGEADFKKCKACHMIVGADGTEIQKGGKTGPNLFGVIGRKVGAAEGFTYSDALAAIGAKGVVWDEAMLAEYVADPGAWAKAQLDDPAAKVKMTFRLAKGGEDMAAYLATTK